MKKLISILLLIASISSYASDDNIPDSKINEIREKTISVYSVYYKTPADVCWALNRVYRYEFTYEIDKLDPNNKKVRYMVTLRNGIAITYLNTFLILPYSD